MTGVEIVQMGNSLNAVYDLLRKTRINGGKIAFTNGCFDVVHVGHVKFLRWLKSQAGYDSTLVVGLNVDDSVRRLKGNSRPVNTWYDRALVLASLRYVDVIIGFGEERYADTPEHLIRDVHPDILAKGGDYQSMVGEELVRSYGGLVVAGPYISGVSTSIILEKGAR